MRKILFFILPLLIPLLANAGESRLLQFLHAIPGAEVKAIDSSAWVECYLLMLPQPVDHANPGGPQFRQKIIVGHRGYDRPVVMETEGYGAQWVNGFIVGEPARLLDANQLYIEHRYFGNSVPEKMDWRYLTAGQDAADYHAIRELFGKIYSGKWIATGVSKGGQTATEYKVFYPDDVDVTIPYVAPINYKRLDKRINRHFRIVGTDECRDLIRDIQLYLLKNKKVTLPLYDSICKKQGFNFRIMDVETAFDYSVLELPFSFWQYTADCSRLPARNDFNPLGMVSYLINIVSPFWYTDASKAFEPANYQFYTQLGYYEYNEWPFRKYLKHKDYPNSAFVPQDADIRWDNSYIRKMKRFLKGDPQHMLYIYGESDPWGATSAPIKPGGGSLKVVISNGTHGANIASMSPLQKQMVFDTLEKWLNMKLPANENR